MTTSALGRVDVLVIGGGGIVHDQILPSLYHLQRLGLVGPIKICDTRSTPLRALNESAMLREAFPDQTFIPHPPLDTHPEIAHPELYRQVLAEQKERQLVIVTVPDHLHGPLIWAALEHNQHVLCVSPLVGTYQEAQRIAQQAFQQGLLVAVEYHKRFNRGALDARLQYRRGRFGHFRLGEAKLIEPFSRRYSDLQHWFTKENANPFTSLGCHYVDLVYYITGLRPVEVAVRGVEESLPSGQVGYLWSAGRVVWENGAILSVLNGFGYPDEAPGSSHQGLVMYCEGPTRAGIIEHDGQCCGMGHGYIDHLSGAPYRLIHPDSFRLVPWEGEGLKPVGSIYDSMAAVVQAALQVNLAGAGFAPEDSLRARQRTLTAINDRGLLATPANSYINELVIEAARLSILHAGMPVEIRYDQPPCVSLRIKP